MPRARADVVSPSPQPSPKRRGRFRSFCCRFSSGRLGISPASAILDCRAWPWLWTSPSATSLLFDSRLSLLRGWWSVSPAGVGIHPGSESGTCFHSNRSCRLAPAHQGMKNRSCDLVWRVGAVDSATPLLDPCGGQAPALQDSGICRNDEARRGNRDSRARWDASIPDRSPGHAFVPMPRMIHSLLIETVGESVWAKLLGTTSHRDASISSAGGRPSGVTGGSCSTTT